jgi:hypothetical protein
MFITKIYSKLKVLSVTSLCEDMTYLDAVRWEKLILKYLPQLEKYYFKYDINFENDHDILMYLGKSNQFTSTFWIERK